MSEPPSSDTNGDFLYIYIYIIYYVSYVVPHILNLSNLTHVTSIKYVYMYTCSTMESYSNSSARVPESSRNRENRLQRNFHAEIAALEMQKCTTCSEAFPGLQLRSHSTECMRCNRDKHVPKLYSSMNNMPRRTSRTAPPALHALAHPSHSSSRSPPQCCAFT